MRLGDDPVNEGAISDTTLRRPWVRALVRGGNALAALSGIAIVGLMLLTTADVIARKGFAAGVPAVIEVSEVALVAVVFLAITAAEFTGTHVRTPLVVERLPQRARPVARLVGLVPCVVFVALVVWGTGSEAVSSVMRGEFRFGIAFVPVWPAKVLIPIGFLGLGLALVVRIVDQVAAIRASSEARSEASA